MPKGYYERSPRIPPRIPKGYYERIPRIPPRMPKDTSKRLKFRLGLIGGKKKTRINSLPKEGGRRHRVESCTVDLGSKKERPKEIAGLSKEEGSEPRCR